MSTESRSARKSSLKTEAAHAPTAPVVDPAKPPRMALVVWEDAKVIDDCDTWAENKPATYKPHLFHQVGFVTLMDEQGIHMTAAWSEDLIAKRDQIPRAMVRSIVYLEPEAPKKPGRKRNATQT
jgi:hypothetical protein